MALVKPATVNKAITTGTKFGAGAVGLVSGFAAQKVAQSVMPTLSFLPAGVQKYLPGVVVMAAAVFAASQTSNQKLQYGLFGLGISGASDFLYRLLGTSIPFFMNAPSNGMNGMRGLRGTQGAAAINVGDYKYSYYRNNAFQGLGKMRMQGMSMQGAGAYALNGANDGAYALNGGQGGDGNAYALSGRKRRGLRGVEAQAYALN